MRPPRFWTRPPEAPGWQAAALAPLGALYALATRRRVVRTPAVSAPVPVISVGNLNVGGTGKTPVVLALAERLRQRGHEAHVVTRGYGGSAEGPLRARPSMDASVTGDEPLLLSAVAPTWVSKDRAAGVRAALDAGAGVILLDDAHQNPAVAKDLSIVVVDAAQGFGNGRVLPAGPLREPVDAGLARADLVLAIGAPAAQDEFSRRWAGSVSVPLVEATLDPLQTGYDWQGQRVVAFAGIGRPGKFFATLRDLGAVIVHAEPLDDHQPLSDALLSRLEHEALALDAQLVTTEKDAVRLPPSHRGRVLVLPVRLSVRDWTPLDSALGRLGL